MCTHKRLAFEENFGKIQRNGVAKNVEKGDGGHNPQKSLACFGHLKGKVKRE